MKKKFLIVSTVPTTLNFFGGQINFLNKTFDVELVSSPDDMLYGIAEREGVNAHAVKMVREISLLKDLKSLFQLIVLFKKLKPHIVHGNTPKGGLLSMTASWVARVPRRIYYVHGLRYEGDIGFKRKILKNIERLSCYLATDIISVSHGVKENMAKDSITSKTPHIIGNGSANGINPNKFSRENIEHEGLKEKYNISETDLLFGYVGRLVGDKGINELITVFSELNKTYSHIKLLLVGWYEELLDPLKVHIKQEIISNNNIIAVGGQDDVRPFLNIMDVFVFPSYREGFGVSIMEAAAMDLPVICSNISGCNEIIMEGYNGKLVTAKSKAELSNAMELFINNPEKITEMKGVTRSYVLKKYNQETVWKEALKTYETISFPDK
ncbi:glycosyltransferase family 4 protein [Hwangdonia lutea]|uniref:Glycosyltransferase family 4 protein n=1 Tax=Hwangdonia lutea TaxID=3075823 RepID=A0AA97HPU6_9FLAO|nr:glycosyltransferase family 4 protein [Hwangdonia sp. SCSIO 19198]WOD43366.1 glycosyltransferase family 4 protein [Hwangdonia sp. SCSIO 19198]